MAILSNNPVLMRWEPATIRTYLVRVAGKLLTDNHQLTIKTPDNHLHPKEWDDWMNVGLTILQVRQSKKGKVSRRFRAER